MTLKPVKFDDYLKWFDEHKVVVKAQTANGVKFKTPKATAKKLLEKVNTVSITAETSEYHLTAVNNYFGKDNKSSEQELPANALEQSVNDAAEYECLFEYFVNDDGVVMVKCDGFVVGPAVSLEWENEVEEAIFESEWEDVAFGGDEDTDGWDIV